MGVSAVGFVWYRFHALNCLLSLCGSGMGLAAIGARRQTLLLRCEHFHRHTAVVFHAHCFLCPTI